LLFKSCRCNFSWIRWSTLFRRTLCRKNDHARAVFKTRFKSDPYLVFQRLSYLLSLTGTSNDTKSEVCYLQSQNGNFHSTDSLNGVLDNSDISEFEPLACDVPKDISWCTKALGFILSRLRYSMSTQFSRTHARGSQLMDRQWKEHNEHS
jgi:hypothetical protein